MAKKTIKATSGEALLGKEVEIFQNGRRGTIRAYWSRVDGEPLYSIRYVTDNGSLSEWWLSRGDFTICV